jgi:hypothetical protein
MAIAQTTLTTSIASIYTSTGVSAVTTMFFLNNSGATVTFSVLLKAGAGTGTLAANGILKEISLIAGDTYIFNSEKIILDTGDQIQAVASAGSAVVTTISYVGL